MPPLRREMLLDALERLLKETGFLHLQTSEIAARLHCSKQTLYFLAPSRMQLFELVVQRLFDRICRETDTAAAQAKDWRGAAISHLDGAVFATRGVGPQFLYDLYAFPAVVESYRKRRVDGFAAIIREGNKAGIFKNVNPKLAAEALLRAVTILHDANFMVSQGLTPPQSHAQLHRLLLDGLLQDRLQTKSPAARAGTATKQRANVRGRRTRREIPAAPGRGTTERYLL
jgi:AcrR family transcriptional regulator